MATRPTCNECLYFDDEATEDPDTGTCNTSPAESVWDGEEWSTKPRATVHAGAVACPWFKPTGGAH